MIPAFKKPPKVDLDIHKKYFKTQLVKVRIKTEHCNELVKTLFQSSNQNDREKSMERLLQLINCVFVIHNLLIYESIPDNWKEDAKTYGISLKSDDERIMPIDRNSQKGEQRKQCFHYLLEVRVANR
ncbi:Hypothetical protein PHPALM_14209 [Phytophthora palmivora]|uniref:DDE Tnp4 domain-containing protein n=1 Tax=Phytophthora palmivora TaxID=4796 RepID=A0A2P4XVB7_9STRA|nr:Hypothetical protein PHPALM_14209 [Phytophthora palmivora]